MSVVTPTSADSDHWETPREEWSFLLQHLPAGCSVWDPFVCEGRARVYLQDMGFTFAEDGEEEDFFNSDIPTGCTTIVTNPPWTLLEQIMPRLLSYDATLYLLVPAAVTRKQWWMKILRNERVDEFKTLNDPVHFIREGKQRGPCPFPCVWVKVN